MHYQISGIDPKSLAEGRGCRHEKDLLVDERDCPIGYDLRKHTIVGPLKETLHDTELLVTGQALDRVLFIGDTRSGKTRSITSICSSLGGFVYEELQCERTLNDFNIVFVFDSDWKTINGVDLNSHAGHNIDHSENAISDAHRICYNVQRSDPGRYVLVIDGSAPIDDQLEIVRPLVKLSSLTAEAS